MCVRTTAMRDMAMSNVPNTSQYYHKSRAQAQKDDGCPFKLFLNKWHACLFSYVPNILGGALPFRLRRALEVRRQNLARTGSQATISTKARAPMRIPPHLGIEPIFAKLMFGETKFEIV